MNKFFHLTRRLNGYGTQMKYMRDDQKSDRNRIYKAETMVYAILMFLAMLALTLFIGLYQPSLYQENICITGCLSA